MTDHHSNLSGPGAFMLLVDRLADASGEIESLKRAVGDLRDQIKKTTAERDAEMARWRSILVRCERLEKIAADHNSAQEPLRQLYESGDTLRKVIAAYVDAVQSAPLKKRPNATPILAALDRYDVAAKSAVHHIDLIPF